MTGEERLAGRPRFGRYPVPWFITLKTTAGDWEWRIIDPQRVIEAVEGQLCFVCGQPFVPHALRWFAIGPMCAVSRVSAEPPIHLECGEYAVKVCPFLSDPTRVRRGWEETAPLADAGMIARNPGVTLLYATRHFTLTMQSDGRRLLCELAPPVSVRFYCEGREATAEEVRASFDSGLPTLRAVAEREGLESQALLLRRIEEAREWLPK